MELPTHLWFQNIKCGESRQAGHKYLIVNSQFHTTPGCGRQEPSEFGHLQSGPRYPKMLTYPEMFIDGARRKERNEYQISSIPA